MNRARRKPFSAAPDQPHPLQPLQFPLHPPPKSSSRISPVITIRSARLTLSIISEKAFRAAFSCAGLGEAVCLLRAGRALLDEADDAPALP